MLVFNTIVLVHRGATVIEMLAELLADLRTHGHMFHRNQCRNKTECEI